MKKYISIIAAFFLLASFNTGSVFAAVVVPPAGYEGPYEEVCKDELAKDSTVCQDNEKSSTDTDTSPIYGPNGVLPRVANILAIFAGIIAVVMIMWGGLTFITSQGETKRPDGRPGKVVVARNTIIYASVGLVIVLLARIIIEFILRTIA